MEGREARKLSFHSIRLLTKKCSLIVRWERGGLRRAMILSKPAFELTRSLVREGGREMEGERSLLNSSLRIVGGRWVRGRRYAPLNFKI